MCYTFGNIRNSVVSFGRWGGIIEIYLKFPHSEKMERKQHFTWFGVKLNVYTHF